MSKISTKELIICIVTIVALVLVLTTNVFATVPGVESLAGDATNNATNEYESIEDEGNNVTGNNNTNNTLNNVVNNATNNVSNNVSNINANNTTIPDAGLDQSIMFVIVIFGISAVYAYKKIRDYKNI